MGHYDGMVYEGSFRELRISLNRLIYDKGVKCPSCGKEYDSYSIEFEEHDGGLMFDKYGQKYWVWITCHNCKYQAALWKLFRQIKPSEIGIGILYVNVEKDWRDYIDEEFSRMKGDLDNAIARFARGLKGIEDRVIGIFGCDVEQVRGYLVTKVAREIFGTIADLSLVGMVEDESRSNQ